MSNTKQQQDNDIELSISQVESTDDSEGPPPPLYIPIMPIIQENAPKVEVEFVVLESKTYRGKEKKSSNFIHTLHSNFSEGVIPDTIKTPRSKVEIDLEAKTNRGRKANVSTDGIGHDTVRKTRSKSQEPKNSEAIKARSGRLSSPPLTTELDTNLVPDPNNPTPSGPPPPIYIPAPPTTKKSGLIIRENSRYDPPPPSYIPPLPSSEEFVLPEPKLGKPTISLSESQLDLQANVEDDMKMSKDSVALILVYLINNLHYQIKEIEILGIKWVQPMIDIGVLAKSIVQNVEETIVNVIKFLSPKIIAKFFRYLSQMDTQQPIANLSSQIYSNLSELCTLVLSLNVDIPDHFKTKIKTLNDTRKNYKKYMEDQSLISEKYVYFSTVIPILDNEIESLEQTSLEFSALAKHTEREFHKLLVSLKKEITLSVKHLTELRSIFETELMYMRNLMELTSRITIPQKFKLELFVPGRRFLQSTLVDHYVITNGKLKLQAQVLVFHFSDIIVFCEIKQKDTKKEKNTLRTSPPKIAKKHKVMEYMVIDHLSLKTKGFGSDNIIELSSPGKKMIIGINDDKAMQELLKHLTTHTLCVSPKPSPPPQKDITSYEKKEKKSKHDKIYVQ